MNETRIALAELYNGQSVRLEGVIERYGKYCFDGYDQKLEKDPKTGLTPGISFYNRNTYINPIRYIKNATLLKQIKLNGKPADRDHIWLPEWLPEGVGSPVVRYGHVYPYRREDGTFDYGFEPYGVDR